MASARITKKGNIRLTLSKPEATAVFILTGWLCDSNEWGRADSDVYDALNALIVATGHYSGDALRVFPQARGPLPALTWKTPNA
jgi:hypothetical protein